MAHLLRGKQAGIQNDFSAAVTADFFIPDDLRRYGISSRITQLAYDPVQSLLAAGTASTPAGSGQVYVFGQKRICANFPLVTPKASVKWLRFCSDRLLVLDDKNDFSVFSLETKTLIASYSPPGHVSAVASDPTLDFAILGMQNGDILAYDIDREAIAPFRLPCFASELNPRARSVPVVSLSIHPRDIGTLLIGYTEGAVLYSFKQNKPVKTFKYFVPRGAPGGDSASMTTDRSPKLTQAVWHPTGTYIMTGHEDSSMVTWDTKEGKLILARTLTETNVDQPQGSAMRQAESAAPKTPLSKIAWCANGADPDDTAILVAGGAEAFQPAAGLTLFELGRTPVYMTTPWNLQAEHFANPKRQRMLPTPPGVEVVDFCLVPRKTPWFAGAHDPIAIIALLASGEITTLSFPSGYPISPSNQLPLSLTFVHPFVTCLSYTSVGRGRWLGLTENRTSGPKFLVGGAEATHPLKRYEDRSIVQMGHADGSVRIWDAGHGDEIENDTVVQADVGRALGRADNLFISQIAMSGASGELAAGLRSGEMIIFRWGRNKAAGKEPIQARPKKAFELVDVSDQKEPNLGEGFHPFTMLDQQAGPVTALKVSDVGFIAVGYESGALVVIDMRGPAIIFTGNATDVVKQGKHGGFMKRRDDSAQQSHPTTLEFSVMTLENENYSSILLHAGTSSGHVLTFKILPDPSGRYSVAHAGITVMENPVTHIFPIASATGLPAYASQSVVGNLRSGVKVDGALLCITRSEARIFRPGPSSKGAHKSWDSSVFCDAAGVTKVLDLGMALVCLFGDGTARAFSLPGLREIASTNLSGKLDAKRNRDAAITPSGDLISWTGPSELAMLNVWGTGADETHTNDRLLNPSLLIPPRPTISNFQWVSGTQFITPSDLDILIGGPNRPPSKRMLAQSRADEAAARDAARNAATGRATGTPMSAASGTGDQEGYWAYMQRQVQERTEKLGLMGDSMDRLEDNSSGWANDVNKYVAKQKRGLVTSGERDTRAKIGRDGRVYSDDEVRIRGVGMQIAIATREQSAARGHQTFRQLVRAPPSARTAAKCRCKCGRASAEGCARYTAADNVATHDLPTEKPPVHRLNTTDVHEQGQTLKDAAEQSLNIILDLTLDGKIRWVSPSWQNIVGTPPESVFGVPIEDVLLDNKTVFADAVQALKADDSGSKNVRFAVQMGPDSLLKIKEVGHETEDPSKEDSVDDSLQVISLEAQGIMVYTPTSDESHTMWMIKPAVQREVTIDLPEILVDSLGVGAEMLAQHLTLLATLGPTETQHHPEPAPVLCRICERQITPWWFPKHTELCLQEHQAEAELQLAQESLTDHRNQIVKVLDALEVQHRYKTEASTDATAIAPPMAEYNGQVIGTPSVASSTASSRLPSPGVPASRERSMSRSGGLHHRRARSFTVRRPLARIVELVLDLCDTALEISTPALKEARTGDDEIRTQSPQSEGRITQVQQWQSPGGGALDNEFGLSALCEDTAKLCRAKVEAVMYYRRILEYSERIRSEYTSLVQECIDAALHKAAQVAAGDVSSDELSSDDSTSREHTADEAEIPQDPPASFKSDSPLSGSLEKRPLGSSLASALKAASRSPSQSPHRRLSSVISTRSSSPHGCPTPRSHAGTLSTLTQDRVAQLTDTEAGGESDDGSVRSSVRSRPRRVDSPKSESGPAQPGASRERKRTSLVLPRAMSISRHPSPARPAGQPQSPMRLTKPRLPSGQSQAGDGVKSPLMSPTLSSSEFHSPVIHPQQLPMRHHRRQSSAASSDILRMGAPMSPQISMTNNPQPKAVPPSIRDFEIIKPISKGAFGSVYLSKKKSTGDYFAIKALKKADMVAKNQVTNVKAERAIMMRQGESDFVAKLYWTFPSKDYIFLVMEYLNGGDCASLVRALGALPEDWAKRYMAEVVQGVEHLHSREIVHRDLKPDNLLIDQKGHLKLTDFGLSRMGLIGRQKRALKAEPNTNPPDPFKQGPFARSASMASSRSASFDFQGSFSPGQTPAMTPAHPSDLQPSYFSLSRETSIHGREPARQNSQHASDVGDTEQLQAAFRRFSMVDNAWDSSRSSPQEDSIKEDAESPDGGVLSKSISNTSNMPKHNTPPQNQASQMPPPPLALFDPDDSNRRFVGTPDYLAPETINGLGQDELSDWWSLGCILFEFLYGYPPFHAKTPDQVFENILHRKIDWPEDDGEVSDEAKDLMNRLMCLEPSKRLGANADEAFESGGEEIKKHPWFADIEWDTLNEKQPSFVPASDDPENTEYFDARGATPHDFATEFEDQNTSPALTPSSEYPDRPHDALSRVRIAINFNKRGLMPLSIPPHVRESRSRRLSEPVVADDFGQFSFKNLPVLEKANKDVIQKLRAEALQAQSRSSQQPPKPQSPPSQPPPALEGSPMLPMPMPMPLKRTLSTNRGGRSASPSQLAGAANPSPNRGSQPSSPLVQFSAGQHERRKTSSGSSNSGAGSLQPGSFFEVPRLSTSLKTSSAASSPIRPARSPIAFEKQPIPNSSNSPRARSHTVGSSESDPSRERISKHQKQHSQVLDVSPSSSDNDETRQKALLQVQRRRQNSRRMSQITLNEGPIFRPLDVLICEDHPISRIVMEKLFEKLRCRAIIVQNGAECMRYAMGLVKFDLIVMEYKLPQVSGADVARMIRETKNANCHTPIVACTGYLKELQTPNNFNGLIEKPPTEEKLVDIMTRLCHWRPTSSGGPSSSVTVPSMPIPPAMPHSNLRHESFHNESSPTSTSSGYAAAAFGSSYHGSSREDSISSASVYTDDVRSEGASSLGNKHYLEERFSGLGISEAAAAFPRRSSGLAHAIAGLSHEASAPGDLASHAAPIEYGADDEDEELGTNRARSRSPRAGPTGSKFQPSSKLTTEMLRQDSQSSVITVAKRSPVSTPLHLTTDAIDAMHLSATTPPEVFEQPPDIQPLGKEHATLFQQSERLAPVVEAESEATPRAI
ncbi:hypothetical protein FH972_025532 [Carpinus fangiana]|uniref:non-specific serine/threonine protein kinase n=1 Tax=Carpinus fangiana TaxID=176857 RepID=A0A5N6L1P2_9ROSI|nr:hypothetical protein FH972_025532 [Carpinus fangiana]